MKNTEVLKIPYPDKGDSAQDAPVHMQAISISKVFETVRNCRKAGVQLDFQTMVWVEYWLMWCIEHNDSSLKDDATAFSLQ